MNSYFTSLYQYVLLSAPYLVLGLTVSALVKVFLSNEWIKKQLGQKGFLGPLKATLIGIPLPLCSCSVIPTAITFKKAGASKASTSAFLIATPESGVDSIAMTYAMMDIPMTIIRPIAAFASGLFAAALQFIFPDKEESKLEDEPENCCPSKQKKPDLPFALKLKDGINYAYHDLMNDIALWLLIGLLMGAAIEAFVPDDYFMGIGEHQSRMAILLLGIPLYICASATTPIAAALMIKGLSPGTALLLLLVGPATNASNFIVLQNALGKKTMILNILSVIIVSLIFSYATDYLYAAMDWKLSFNIEHLHEHDDGPTKYTYACAILVTFLILRGVFEKNVLPLFKKAS